MNDTVSIAVGTAKPILIPWVSGMNAHVALEAAYNQIHNSTEFSFALQFFGTYQGPPYGPLGYMVIMLNGIYDLPGENTYWHFSLNGAGSKAGIDYTFLSPGDAIGFTSEVYDEHKHRGTHLEIRHRHYASLRALHAASV